MREKKVFLKEGMLQIDLSRWKEEVSGVADACILYQRAWVCVLVLFLVQFCASTHAGRQQMTGECLVPAALLGDLERVPGSWLWHDAALAEVVSIWGMTRT